MSMFDDRYEEYMQVLEERILRIRDIDLKTGKIKWRFRTDKKGYRIKTDPNTGMKQEIKQTSQEKLARSRAAKNTARRRKMKPKGFKKQAPSWVKQKRNMLIKK